MKNKIIRHLVVRIGAPFLILFLVWEFGDLKNGSLEESLLFSIFASFFIFLAILFVIKETLIFNKTKEIILRNINIVLLIFYISFFLFMTIASFAIASF